MEVKPTLVEAQSPSGFGKVPYTTFGPPILTNTSDIRILPFHFYLISTIDTNIKHIEISMFPQYECIDFS